MKNELFYKGNFGLERETLRVDKNGRLAHTPHTFTDSAITRDFCENQIELITPVCSSVHDAVSELARLDRTVRCELSKNGESLWMYSNPPYIESENEIDIAQFTGKEKSKTEYRLKLQKRYGKRLMLFSGVHFNFSFSDGYLRSICDTQDLESFKNKFYLRLYKQACIHSWLILLLTASSPVYDRSFDNDGAKGGVRSIYSSIRNSKRGYWNSFVPFIDCSDMESFTHSIQSYVDSGKLFDGSELYLPVRLKPKGKNTLENFKNGVSHIELRMFDLDPKQPLGINEESLEFAHLLLMYLSTLPDFEFTPSLQSNAVNNHRSAALLNLVGVEVGGVPIIKKAEQIIDSMMWFYSDAPRALKLLESQRCKLYHRPCMSIHVKDIYPNTEKGDTNVRASRIYCKRTHRYSQTAAGFLFPL